MHAGRKWLVGEAIPTHEKILIIAKWLNVHASWLRFGDAENGKYELIPSAEHHFSPGHISLTHDVAALPAPAQIIIRDIVESFMRLGSGEKRCKGIALKRQRLIARVGRAFANRSCSLIAGGILRLIGLIREVANLLKKRWHFCFNGRLSQSLSLPKADPSRRSVGYAQLVLTFPGSGRQDVVG